jgi:hypothetical protein
MTLLGSFASTASIAQSWQLKQYDYFLDDFEIHSLLPR